MGRFYGKRIECNPSGASYFASVFRANGTVEEVEISEELYEALDDMQREHWRLERRESRHTCHIEAMGEYNLPRDKCSKDPEQILIERIEASSILQAFKLIPAIQQRRFLLRHLAGLSIKEIASLEDCSDRAVKYSLKLARRNLKEILSD
jgi:RNA polymerase sigma-70 factor (ECF subfamily)